MLKKEGTIVDCLSAVFGCEGQYLIGGMLIGIMLALAIITGIWAYLDAYRERQKMRRTPMAIRRIPISDEVRGESYPGQRKLTRFRSHAYPPKTERWPLKGLDRILNNFFRGGSISAW